MVLKVEESALGTAPQPVAKPRPKPILKPIERKEAQRPGFTERVGYTKPTEKQDPVAARGEKPRGPGSFNEYIVKTYGVPYDDLQLTTKQANQVKAAYDKELSSYNAAIKTYNSQAASYNQDIGYKTPTESAALAKKYLNRVAPKTVLT
jgi:hypothetical protein